MQSNSSIAVTMQLLYSLLVILALLFQLLIYLTDTLFLPVQDPKASALERAAPCREQCSQWL